jgi:hypothetical protein
MKIANRRFENVIQFKYLGTTVTNRNLIQEEIRRILNSGNACYHSAQNLLSSRLPSKNIKIRTYKTIILRVILNRCENWSLILWEEHRVRVFENRMMRRIFGQKREEVAENCMMESFITCTLHQVKLERSSRVGCDGQGI